MANTIIKDILESMGDYDEAFTKDILIIANNAIHSLKQNRIIKVGEIDENSEWDSLGMLTESIGGVKSYITLHCKLYFDSPAPSMVNNYSTLLDKTLLRLIIDTELSSQGDSDA